MGFGWMGVVACLCLPGGVGGGCVTVLACLIFVLFVLAQATRVVIKETPDVIWVVFHKRTAI